MLDMGYYMTTVGSMGPNGLNGIMAQMTLEALGSTRAKSRMVPCLISPTGPMRVQNTHDSHGPNGSRPTGVHGPSGPKFDGPQAQFFNAPQYNGSEDKVETA